MVFSSESSVSVAFILTLEKSSIGKPSTMVHSPPEHLTGNEYMRPSATPYLLPVLSTAIDTHLPSGVPRNQLFMWSEIAWAAERAEESLRAAMMAAPRFCTQGIMTSLTHASSLIRSLAGVPLTLQWLMSGYWVEEWLPQMMDPVTCSMGTPHLMATCAMARLWSRRVSAEKFFLGMLGAHSEAMRQLVLAGLPTTSTLTFLEATVLRRSPCCLKMPQFFSRRSLRSMPSLRGKAPSMMTASAPAKATFSSPVHTHPLRRG
mmetsp:Transcript_7394/g.14377  ORF Transcript_7394/g.14377 Transcript_7394/m.14377 type:complete len:261 (+) Transcript_7394:174-956(+)